MPTLILYRGLTLDNEGVGCIYGYRLYAKFLALPKSASSGVDCNTVHRWRTFHYKLFRDVPLRVFSPKHTNSTPSLDVTDSVDVNNCSLSTDAYNVRKALSSISDFNRFK